MEDHQPLIGDAVLDGGPGLMLVIEKFPEANTRAVTRAVEDALEQMKPGLAGIQIDTTVYRPASFLHTALHNLGWWALVGLLLVLALLAGFTLSWRMALISPSRCRLSLVAAAYVLYLRGTTFNMMVLAGLAVALGIVIDDAVAGVEAIRRRLREQPRVRGAACRRRRSWPMRRVAVRGPLVYATLIVLLAAVPALALGGRPGAFARAAGPVVRAGRRGLGGGGPHRHTRRWPLLLLANEPISAAPARGVAPLVARGYDRWSPGTSAGRGSRVAAFGILLLAGLAILPQLDIPRRPCRTCRIATCSCAGRPHPARRLRRCRGSRPRPAGNCARIPGVRRRRLARRARDHVRPDGERELRPRSG